MTPEITRRFTIDYGHRLLNHEGKCRSVHGHRGIIDVSCRGLEGLDPVGRVIDFGVIKDLVGGWLNDIFDHGMIVESGDPLEAWLREHDQKTVVIDVPPTIENLAGIWFEGANTLLAPLKNFLQVTKVHAFETENCSAIFTADDYLRSKSDMG